MFGAASRYQRRLWKIKWMARWVLIRRSGLTERLMEGSAHPSARLDLRSLLAADWSTLEVGINSLVLYIFSSLCTSCVERINFSCLFMWYCTVRTSTNCRVPIYVPITPCLTFRHRASCILGQAFRCSPENAFYIFNQQIYFIIWYLLDRASLI
jgi:hypothetical protein